MSLIFMFQFLVDPINQVNKAQRSSGKADDVKN